MEYKISEEAMEKLILEDITLKEAEEINYKMQSINKLIDETLLTMQGIVKPIAHAQWIYGQGNAPVCSDCFGECLYDEYENRVLSLRCPHCGAIMELSPNGPHSGEMAERFMEELRRKNE